MVSIRMLYTTLFSPKCSFSSFQGFGMNVFFSNVMIKVIKYIYKSSIENKQLSEQAITSVCDLSISSLKIAFYFSSSVDKVHADVLIPFSYVQNTIYKQDVQFSPQHPESIIRLEVNTFSKSKPRLFAYETKD